MKNVILFDTSIASTNKGDDIIMHSAERGLQPLLKDKYVLKVPTHLTPFSLYQTHCWWKAKWVRDADYKFICGTNLLWKTLIYPVNDLNINFFTCSPMKNSVLVGVGNSLLNKWTDPYTKAVYNKVLSKDYIHSTRDDETRDMLRGLGFKAVTTGCVTLWPLTPELCKEIPVDKAPDVVFTLNGTGRDSQRDQFMLDTLKKNYRKRYFYVQTIWDIPYFETLSGIEDIELIDPDISTYGEFLDSHDVDYVGNRLHGGVYAMQHKKRAIIINIDNRARNMSKVNHLNILERENIAELPDMLTARIHTDVRMDFDLIQEWMEQF